MRTQTIKLALLIAFHSTTAFAQSPLQVKTDTGIVEGKTQGAVREFLGIPYAAPPAGEHRWKAPAPPAAWTGVLKATEFGKHCMQAPIFGDMVFPDPGMSEDCLTLNVWTPAKDVNAKLPVMVWIYGGGLAAGATSEPRQNGAILTERGVVVVSMNYRLGIFGFFALPELMAESGQNAAGNYGLMDQLAALRWVKRNIAAFGGDPSNVTIFGESAGSFSVSLLMASPLAKGLFQKAIGESGGDFAGKLMPFVTAKESAAKDAEYARTGLGTDSLKELREMPADKLLEATSKPDLPRRVMGIVVDGYFLPKPAREIFAAHEQNDVPLLAGWNHDEGSFGVVSAKPPIDAARVKELAEKEFGAKTAEFFKLYPADTDQMAVRSWEDFAGDRFIAYGTWKWLEMQATTSKKPVYRFRFDLAPPRDPKQPEGMGAYHSAEIEYVFGTLDWRIPTLWRPEDRAVSELMRKYWANFARSGDPNGPGLPNWPMYKPNGGAEVMYLNATSKAEKDPQRARYLFLESVWDK